MLALITIFIGSLPIVYYFHAVIDRSMHNLGFVLNEFLACSKCSIRTATQFPVRHLRALCAILFIYLFIVFMYRIPG